MLARHRTGPALVLVALVALCAASCERAAPPQDILLVTIDTLRADRVGAWGHAAARTPVLDGLARSGVRFAACQSPVPVTLPSHASILTGRYPPGHGVRNNTSYRLPPDTPTLAARLRDAGYTTGAFVAAVPLARRFGLDAGFDRYDDTLGDEPAGAFTFRERPAPEVVRAALAWLRGRPAARPVFLWVHFFEPHAPYEPGPDWSGDPYDGEVAAADRALGALLTEFAAVRGHEPLTVITSDHGESLGEHGEASHAVFLYQSTLHVPLILHAPGRWPAAVIDEPVSLVDVAPTILAAVGVASAPMQIDGIALDPTRPVPRRALYSESVYGMEAYRWAPLFALRTGPHKVIRSARSHAFDLAADPDETRDLMATDAEWIAADLRSLDRQIAADPFRRPGAERQPTREERDALAALGYASSSGGHAADLLRALRELPDATGRHDELAATHGAEVLIAGGDTAGAIARLDRVLSDNPDNVWALMLRERALGAEGRTAEAIDTCRRAIGLRPDWVELHRDLGRLLRDAGNADAAVAAFGEALARDPGDTQLRIEAAGLLQAQGRSDEALDLLAAGLAHTDDPLLHAALARLCLQTDRIEEGRHHLLLARTAADGPELRRLDALYARRAGDWAGVLEILTDAPASAPDDELRAEALQRLGRPREAVVLYERALAASDSQALSHNNLAWALATSLDRADEALPHARRAVALDPDEPEYRDTLVEVLLRLGREDEARQELEQALARHPEHPGLRARSSGPGRAREH